MKRRTFIAAGSGIVLGATSIATLGSDPAKGQVSIGSFNIADKSKDVQNAVSGATLTVSGSYAIDSDVVPDKLIIRLEAKAGLTYSQIGVTTVSNNLSKDRTDSYSISGNLLQSDITAPDLSPANVGNSKTVAVDCRVTVDVRHDGRVIESYSQTSQFDITVNKTVGSVQVQVDGSGSLTLTES